MCVIAFAVLPSSRFPFIFINNRDEFLSRKTTQPLLDPSGALCARDVLQVGSPTAGDLLLGGTWLGVNIDSFDFCGLTNCRRCASTVLVPPAEQAAQADSFTFTPSASRGEIVLDYLASKGHRRARALGPPHYAGFNVLHGNLRSIAELAALPLSPEVHSGVFYTTNRFEMQQDSPLPVGYHALSNTFLDNPIEPKSCLLRERLQQVVEGHPDLFCFREDADGAADLSHVLRLLSEPLCEEPNYLTFSDGLIESVRPLNCKGFPGLLYALERELQRNVYTFVKDAPTPTGGVDTFQTRAQTVVLVERLQHCGASGRGYFETSRGLPMQLHYCYRETQSPTRHDAWRDFAAQDNGMGPRGDHLR